MKSVAVRGSTGLGFLVLLFCAGCAYLTPIGPGFIYEPDKREQRMWQACRSESAELANSGALYNDPALTAYVQSVLSRLMGEYQNAYTPLKPRVFLLDAESVNAFVWPHGDIYIHTGILGRTRNEAQLAMLLGHELTHSTHRHAHQKVERAYAASGVNAYVQVLSVLANPNLARMVRQVSRMLTLIAINGYGREKESESDRVGLTLMAQAGYDPKEGGQMFQRMLDASPKHARSWSFFYSSHPKMKNRVKSCGKLILRLPPELLANATEIGRDRYLDAAIHLIHDEVGRHITQGRYDLATETLAFLAEARPSDPVTYGLRGDLYRARVHAGDQEKALAAYQHALDLDNKHATAHRGIGLLHLRRGEKEEALKHLTAYVQFAPDAPDIAYIQQYVERLTGEE